MTIVEKQNEALADVDRREFVRTNWALLRVARAGLSQRQVAEAAGVATAYVCRVERGRPDGIGKDALKRVLNVYHDLMENMHERGKAV